MDELLQEYGEYSQFIVMVLVFLVLDLPILLQGH